MEVVTLEIALRSSCAGSACGTESQSTFVRPKILRVCILRPSPRPRKQFSGWFNPIYPYLFTMGQAIVLYFAVAAAFQFKLFTGERPHCKMFQLHNSHKLLRQKQADS